MAEQRPFKPWVVGSSPTAFILGTSKKIWENAVLIVSRVFFCLEGGVIMRDAEKGGGVFKSLSIRQLRLSAQVVEVCKVLFCGQLRFFRFVHIQITGGCYNGGKSGIVGETGKVLCRYTTFCHR